VLIGVGIVGIGGFALIVLRSALKLTVKRIVIARGVGVLLWLLIGLHVSLLLGIVLVLRCRQRAAQRMNLTWIVLLRGRLPLLRHGARVGALHPGRRPRRLLLDRFFVLRLFVSRRLIPRRRARRGRRRRVRLAHGAEWIGLPDQPRQLGERIAAGVMLISAAIILV